ncbi:molecular chaperone DjiA [Capnocytophaga sp. oral taxon 902]|uniref:molecular chaperone DjiA n=1 Tax=Capnocytophaga sp. oral taxon 902 TaxID=2748316 RepID=UPI0015BEEDB4|nr:molecular chaperone DjiA [Capnocytophaga sp. oral taxon 902]QLF50207.1 molecular chaperone DjiA [Capnocytophaga sp. oral taxon 902]
MSLFSILIFLFFFWLFRQLTEQPFRNPFQQNISPATFELNLLSLCSLVIKANGRVTQAELDFVRLQFVRLYGKERANAVFRSFNKLIKGRQIEAPRVAMYVRARTTYETRLQILYFLFGIAQADGVVSQDEVQQIEQIAYYFQIEKSDFISIKAMFANTYGSNSYTQTPNENAYAILGISPQATDAEVKQAYRNMAKKYHPDRVITEDEAIKKGAEEKFKQVQQAYEQIARQRGMN